MEKSKTDAFIRALREFSKKRIVVFSKRKSGEKNKTISACFSHPMRSLHIPCTRFFFMEVEEIRRSNRINKRLKANSRCSRFSNNFHLS